jgi:ribosomal protein S18 acetylase RimI-like enzyme
MRFSIRPAVREDADAVIKLSKEFSDYIHSLGEPGKCLFDTESYLRDGFGPNPAFSGLVADTGAELVGYLLYHEGYELDTAARVLYVIDLYVQKDNRRLGVGRALLDETVDVCRQLGGSHVCWSVYNTNQLAMRFYEGLGAAYINDQRFMCLYI